MLLPILNDKPNKLFVNDKSMDTNKADLYCELGYLCHIIVSETNMCAAQCWLGIKQYIQNYPVKWGIKLFTLGEAEASYVGKC